MASFYTEYLELNEQRKIICKKCGYVFCRVDENYKEYALSAEISPTTISEMRPEDPEFCIYREFYCPECATLLDVDPCPSGDPILWDIELKF